MKPLAFFLLASAPLTLLPLHAAAPAEAATPAAEEKADAKKEGVKTGAVPTPEDLAAKLDEIDELEVPDADAWTKAVKKKLAEFETGLAAAEAAAGDGPVKHALKLLSVQADLMREATGGKATAGDPETVLSGIVAAKEADAGVRRHASRMLVEMGSQGVDDAAKLAVWQKRLADHLAAFPDDPEGPDVQSLEIDLVEAHAPDQLKGVVERLAASKNEQLAEFAKSKLAEIKVMDELKAKPLELKFTAVDGREVDVEKLRGKVVLIDFWATWCGPCMQEVPNVVKTFEKLHEKGFEIIGVSLDEDKAALEKTVKKMKMTWPQSFEGKGWEGATAKRFGITGIPTMWLLDKQGKVSDFDAREGLEEKVTKLLGAE